MCCFSAPRSRPPPRESSYSRHSEKHKYRSGSSSGSGTDASLPSTPELHKRGGHRSSVRDDELPPSRVATSHSRPGSSSARHSAPPPSRRNSSRRRHDGGEKGVAEMPRRRSSTRRTSSVQSPALSDPNYKPTPRTRSVPASRRSSSVSAQTTPRIAVTPLGSPKKGTSSKAFSTSSSHGRLSVATADGSLATSTSPLLRPGGSSRASSDAGSSRSESVPRERKRSKKTEGVVGLGITTEGPPKKAAAATTTSKAAAPVPKITIQPASEPQKAPIPANPKMVPAILIPPPPAPAAAATSTVAQPQPQPQPVPAPAPIPAPAPASAPAPAAPQRPPITRKNAHMEPPPAPPLQLRRKGSSASLSSQFSTSSPSVSSDSTVEAPPPPPPAAPPPKMAPPEKSTVPTPEEAPKPAPKLAPKPAPAKEPTKPAPVPEKRPIKEVSPPPPVQIPVKKYSPARERPSSRASSGTVDYADFVAQNQRKKKEKKLKSLLPDMDESTLTRGTRRSNSVRAKPTLFASSLSIVASPPKIAHTMRVDVDSLNRLNELALMKTEASDSDVESVASTVNSSVVPEPDAPRRNSQNRDLRRDSQCRALRRLKDPDVKPPVDDNDGLTVLSIRMDGGAPPEAPVPPPFAPSPPPTRRGSKCKKKAEYSHLPPRGAADSWYQEVSSGPAELEQDWRYAADVWEEDRDLPEAPSPPRTPGGYAPAPHAEMPQMPPTRRRRKQHSAHGTPRTSHIPHSPHPSHTPHVNPHHTPHASVHRENGYYGYPHPHVHSRY